MILHHYTTKCYLPSIAKSGLYKGQIPFDNNTVDKVVWLTSDLDPNGHGLSDGRMLTVKEKNIIGMPPWKLAAFPNKREVRLSFDIPKADKRLHYWPKWGKRNMPRSRYHNLNRTGGGKSKSWFLYFGTISPEVISAYDLENRCEVDDWIKSFGEGILYDNVLSMDTFFGE